MMNVDPYRASYADILAWSKEKTGWRYITENNNKEVIGKLVIKSLTGGGIGAVMCSNSPVLGTVVGALVGVGLGFWKGLRDITGEVECQLWVGNLIRLRVWGQLSEELPQLPVFANHRCARSGALMFMPMRGAHAHFAHGHVERSACGVGQNATFRSNHGREPISDLTLDCTRALGVLSDVIAEIDQRALNNGLQPQSVTALATVKQHTQATRLRVASLASSTVRNERIAQRLTARQAERLNVWIDWKSGILTRGQWEVEERFFEREPNPYPDVTDVRIQANYIQWAREFPINRN